MTWSKVELGALGRRVGYRVKKRTEGSGMEGGRQERKGQAQEACTQASRGLQGPCGPSPTQPFVHLGHESSTLFQGRAAHCPLPSDRHPQKGLLCTELKCYHI